jgi:hypothetical protein
MSRVFIFVGPTLNHEQIYALLPDAEVYPPIRGGDLIRLAPQPGDLVAIIDGFFYHSTAVRHKEILDNLRKGVHIWGAASMGALRAAELFQFGMRGFGQIFEAYLHGEIEGDDEVAVLHATQDMGYLTFTEALVNIRYACKRAIEAGIISDTVGYTFLEAATALPFYERSYQNISKHAIEKGLSPQGVAKLVTFLQQDHLNLKRQDALELIQALRTRPSKPLETSFEWYETSHVHSWYINEQMTYIAPEQCIFDTEVLTAYQLFSRNYPEIHYHILLKQLVEIARQSHENTQYLAEHDLISVAATYVATQSNLCLEKKLPESLCRWLRSEELQLAPQEQLTKIAIRLWFDPRGFDWRGVLITHLKTSGLFDNLQKLVITVHAFNKKLWGQNAVARCYTIRPAFVSRWFAQRWQVSTADLTLAMLDRGFRDATDFFARACFFYLFDKYVGVENIPPVSGILP